MVSVELTVLVAIVYLAILFTIAYRGDRSPPNQVKPYRYALAQGVHCTTWAFYGTITQSAYYGWAFAPTYIGAILVFLFAHRWQQKLLLTCKQHNITSVADFIGHRFGRSPSLAAAVALIALIAVVPYIALQLRAVTGSFATVTGVSSRPEFVLSDVSILVALAMIGFAILFGTRRLSLAEQHSGLMDAVAFESVVKLVAFMLVGGFVCYQLFDGVVDVVAQAAQTENTQRVLAGQPEGIYVYFTHILLGALSMFCLPRQFHVGYVENNHPDELKAARWAFPLYLFAINFFILPIALAGLILMPDAASSDTFMLQLLLSADHAGISLVAFIGGLAAATSMVIIATLALSIMMSNDVLMPLWLRSSRGTSMPNRITPERILRVRRATVVLIIGLAFGYHSITQSSMPLVNSGLIALALLAQLAPALLGGMLWSGANRAGAMVGLLTGTILWVTLLLLPTLNTSSGLSDTQISDGLLISLGSNLLLFIFVSMLRRSSHDDLNTATGTQLPTNHSGTISWVRLRATLAQFFDQQESQRLAHRLAIDLHSAPADSFVPAPIISRIERELAAVIGSAASRLLLDAISQQPNVPISQVVNWATQASQLYRFNRELLQASVENIPQGISVIDQELRLVAWNRRYLEVFEYPEDFVQAGMPVADLLRYNAQRGLFGQTEHSDSLEQEIAKRLNYLQQGSRYRYQRQQGDRVIELQGSPMPGGGFVTTYTDITELVNSQRELEAMNSELEQRVSARTTELLEAKQAEERAHQSKSRFFAAVSHDLMQPFNAATLLCDMLNQRLSGNEQQLAQQLHQSLHHAEELLTMLLDMNRLDAGSLPVHPETVALRDVLEPLVLNARIVAHEKGLQVNYHPSSARLMTDRKLLSRILQNLISNAVRYTDTGRVVVGAKRRNGELEIWVADTGIGIPADKQQDIFREFHQLHTQGDNPGLGLGLAIVDRMCRLLKIPLRLESDFGAGTCFRLRLPVVDWQGRTLSTPAQISLSEQFLANKSVLVVDNDPALLKAMTQLLEAWGARVLASSGLTELEPLDIEPSLMLVDYHLDHGQTGIDVVKMVRAKFMNDLIPAILNSADASEAIREEAIAVRAQFIPKPVKPAALKRIIKQRLQSS